MAAKTMWRVRYKATIELEVEGEYAYDARQRAGSAVSRFFDGAFLEDISFLSCEQLERAPLFDRNPSVGPKDREDIARMAAEGLPADDDVWKKVKHGTEESEAEEKIPGETQAPQPPGETGSDEASEEGGEPAGPPDPFDAPFDASSP